jgi:hypothetical protein
MFKLRSSKAEPHVLPGPQQPDRLILCEIVSAQLTPGTARSVGPSTYAGGQRQTLLPRIEDYRDVQARALRERLVMRARMVKAAQERGIRR